MKNWFCLRLLLLAYHIKINEKERGNEKRRNYDIKEREDNDMKCNRFYTYKSVHKKVYNKEEEKFVSLVGPATQIW